MKKIVSFIFICLLTYQTFSQEDNAERIYEQLNDAVVRIFTYHDDGTMHGQGSGVIIKKNGWIVTNYHVLGDATSIFAEHKGKFIKLDSVIVIDPNKDIMILQLAKDIDSKDYKAIPDIKLGDSDKLKVGQRVYAIGSPMGFENTITEGIISGLRTSFDSTRSFIQISAPISSGSSGGAILDAKGNLIGISTMVISGETVQNLNFALLINDVISASKTHTKSTAKAGEETVNYYYQKGYSEYISKHYLSAIMNYEKAIKLCGDTEESGLLYYYLGLAYDKLGRYDDAIENYNKSLEKSKIADTYVGLAYTYFEKKEYEKALRNYEHSIELVPGFAEGYIGLGTVYFQQKDYPKAISVLKKAVEINPKSYNAHYLLGEIALNKETYDIAIYFFQQAIKWNPNYAEAYSAMADAYLKMGQTEKAIQYQQKAYQLKPELRNKKDK